MRKLGLVMTPAFVLALALSAVAQEKPLTTKKENDGTIKVNVSGRLAVDYVFRSREMTGFTDSFTGPGPTNSSENTFEGELGIRFDIDLSDKISAVVEIGKERVDGGILTFLGDTQTDFEEIVIRELHVNVGDFMMTGLNLQAGIPTWSFDVRGRGSSFAFDPRHSETFDENVSLVADGNGALADRAGDPDELNPMGLFFSYVRDALQFDVVFLPMMDEGGDPSEDEALYAVDFFYKLDGKGSRVGGILALVALDSGVLVGSPSSVFTLGGGATLKGFVDGLELYGEVYFQFGDAGSDATGSSVDAGGMALQVGARYTLPNNANNIWFEGNITHISGDDSVAADTDSDAFLSYENVNDLLILEDQYFGFDWDSNYFAFKASAGLALSVGAGKNNLELWAILGIARTAEDVEFAGPAASEDALGNEFDVRARWILTKQASLNAGLGILMGSEVVKESMIRAGDTDEDDSALLYTLGLDVRF